MRIGTFELDCAFRTHFTLAEILNGQAPALQSIHVQNVRGGENSWLNLKLYHNGRVLRRKAIRNLAIGDRARATQLEEECLRELLLPRDLTPGAHTLRMEIVSESISQELLFEVVVLPPNIIPTDFVRAPLLPAYMQEGDLLRNFAAGAIQHLESPNAATVMHCLYDALLEKKLIFQPVSARQYPDCQRIAAMTNILEHGGSCAELSLLFASLLWNVGQNPALLLFGDHMAAGCFPKQLPLDAVLNDPAQILSLVQRDELLLVETTSVCRLHQRSFDAACKEILLRLAVCGETGENCVLINAGRILRSGTICVSPDSVRRECSNCHYVAETSLLEEAPVCIACGTPFPPLFIREPVPAAEPVVYSTGIQYALQSGGAEVVRRKTNIGDTLRIMDAWQGRSVVSIGDRAFANSAASAVILPDSLVRIGDYAFLGCKQLLRFIIPDTVTVLGTGAFRDCGLREIRIPGNIVRIPRLAFADCGELAILTLSEGTQFIDEKAFHGCGKLRTVTIPASVKQVYRNAFPPGCELLLMSPATKVL